MKTKTIRRSKVILISLLFNYLTLAHAIAQWEQVNSENPVSTKIYSMLICGTNLYIGTNQGLYLSENNGRNWKLIESGLPLNTAVYSLSKCNMYLFAGTSSSAFISKDGGYSWEDINPDVSNWFMFSKLPVWSIESNKSDIFIATPAGIYSSEYAFSHSENLNSYEDVTSTGYNKLCCDLSWEPDNNDLPKFINVNCILTTDDKVIAATDNGLYYSINNGKTWMKYKSLKINSPVTTIASEGNRIIAGTKGQGIFISDDNGKAWLNCNDGLISRKINSIILYNSKIIAGTDNGVFLTADNGSNWYMLSYELINSRVFSLGVSSDELYAGTIGRGLWHCSLNKLDNIIDR